MVEINSGIPSSKSMVIRELLIRSYTRGGSNIYAPPKEPEALEASADIHCMRQGLACMLRGEVIDCGEAATVFRFLALRAARIPGRHQLTGSARLLARPHGPLISLLNQLSVEVQVHPSHWILTTNGWCPHSSVIVDRSTSSQFVSGLLLNSWCLPMPFRFHIGNDVVSESYWRMSCAMAEQFNLDFQVSGEGPHALEEVVVAAGQIPDMRPAYAAEMDVSCAFALVAAGVLTKGVNVCGFPEVSLQPDYGFLGILQKMGVKFEFRDANLLVQPCEQLQSINVDLRQMPDLFPVLAVLTAFADGESHLRGAPHLRHKESNRIERISTLIRSMGRGAVIHSDGLSVTGHRQKQNQATPFYYDVDHDHRLAMAAGVAAVAGIPIKVSDPTVVQKSFPRFWELLRRGFL